MYTLHLHAVTAQQSRVDGHTPAWSLLKASPAPRGTPAPSMEPGSRQAQHLGGHQHPARSQAQGKLRHHAMYTLSDNFHLKDDVR